jgi:hypothetical protein
MEVLDAATARKLAPLLFTQGLLFFFATVLIMDFGQAGRVVPFAFAILDVCLLYQKERFLASPGFRVWSLGMSAIVFLLAMICATLIPWGWHGGPWFR